MLFKSIIKYSRLLKCDTFYRCVQSHYLHDKNFNYFRNKSEYNNSVIQLNNSIKQNLAGSEMSFLLKDEKTHADGFFYHLMQRENVMKLSTEQIKEIMYVLANTKIDTHKYSKALQFLDEKCALSAERWHIDTLLYIFDAWFIILGPKSFRKHYYSAITSAWSKKINRCSKYNLILILYYIGMSKRAPPFILEMVENKLENMLSDLNEEEWGIVCLSFFKTSKKIDSELVLKHVSKVAIDLLIKDERFHLISILKILRLSKYLDLDLINHLENYIRNQYKSFNFVECTNFLASFTSFNIYKPEAFRCLENQGLICLSTESSVPDIDIKAHPSVRSRIKDLGRFLWGFAFVGHDIKKTTIDFVVDLLNERIKQGECINNLFIMVDCLQSLLLLGHYPKSILNYIVEPSNVNEIARCGKAKPKYQLYFVYMSASIEDPLYFQNLEEIKITTPIPKSLQKDVTDRMGFQELVNYLNQQSGKMSFQCCYIMPHIMISGIFLAAKQDTILDALNPDSNKLLTLIQNKILTRTIKNLLSDDRSYMCIEVLDPSMCVHKSTDMIGLMKAKIQQLNKLNIKVLILTPKDINELTSSGKIKGRNLVDLIKTSL